MWQNKRLLWPEVQCVELGRFQGIAAKLLLDVRREVSYLGEVTGSRAMLVGCAWCTFPWRITSSQ